MAKYILKSSSGWVGTDATRTLSEDEFTDADFEAYEKGCLEDRHMNELEEMAREDQGFEWYIDKVE